MCKKGTLITNFECRNEFKCQSPNCAFCTRNKTGKETCAICSSGYAIRIEGDINNCVKETTTNN